MADSEINKKLLQEDVHFIVPSREYDLSSDKRLLIPFIQGCKIGFVNNKSEIIIEASYDAINGDVYSENDLVRVGISYGYAYERKNSNPAIYTRKKWGLLNHKGEYILEPNYSSIRIEANTITVCKAYGYDFNGSNALFNRGGEEIVPFGTYWNIEPFEEGLARCRNLVWKNGKRMELCGIINETGETILECTERQILPFYGRHRIRNYPKMLEQLQEENPAGYCHHFKKSIPIEVQLKSMSTMEEKREKEEFDVECAANALTRIEELRLAEELYVSSQTNNKIRKEYTYGNVKVIELCDGSYGVMNDGKFVVPFGKYAWIDGFDNGLARVRTRGKTTYTKNIAAIFDFDTDVVIEGQENIQEVVQKEFSEHRELFARWGIIDVNGKEVLPLVYDNIWNFYGKHRYSTSVEKDGTRTEVYFSDLNPELPDRRKNRAPSRYDSYDQHYGEYAGSYAQDVMGYSDDVINDAFEGDPDAYWNID